MFVVVWKFLLLSFGYSALTLVKVNVVCVIIVYCRLKIETLSDEEEYTELLQRMLDELREVVGLLAKAFRALNETVPVSLFNSFAIHRRL